MYVSVLNDSSEYILSFIDNLKFTMSNIYRQKLSVSYECESMYDV